MNTILLSRGVPDRELLPVSQIAEAAVHALAEDPEAGLRYGDAAGLWPLREWVGRRLGVDPERVLLTNGSLQALGMLVSEITADGRWIAVEKPSYDFSIRVLARVGLPLRGVPISADGLSISALQRMIADNGPPSLLYTIPTHQNPTGVTMSAETRTRLVSLAARHHFPIIEDDPYRELFFYAEPPSSLFQIAGDAEVLYLTSFSKTIAPGLRCGVLIAPRELHTRLVDRARETYIAPNHFAQATALAYCCLQRFEPHLVRSRRLLLERCEAMGDALSEHLPYAEWAPPGGGYFLWVRLPGVPSTEVAEAAWARGVGIVPGRDFLTNREESEYLRLSFAAEGIDGIREGVARLATAAREFSDTR